MAEAAFYGLDVDVMVCITDEHLCTVALNATLDAIAVHHTKIADLIGLISPILIERVRRAQQVAPTVAVYVARQLTNEELLRALAGTYSLRRYGAQGMINAYQALLDNPGDADAVISNEAYALLTSITNLPALEFYIRERFHLTLSIVTTSDQDNCLGWMEEDLRPRIRFGRGQHIATLCCCRLTWTNNGTQPK